MDNSTAKRRKWAFRSILGDSTLTSENGRVYHTLRNGLTNARSVFENTRRGRVVFMGGSITNMSGWRELVSEDLRRRFPGTQFDFINAGMPSTGSTPGAFRLERDAFRNGPVDLLFEEAAVNDYYNGRSSIEQVRAMEGLVRHARILNANIDIIIMHFVDPPKMEEYNRFTVPRTIQNHEKVAEHYQIPTINVALEVTERIKLKDFTWDKDFKDLHPSPFGHTIYKDAIARCFDAAWHGKAMKEHPRPHILPDRLDAWCYESGMLLPPDRANPLNGFTLSEKWRNTVGGETRPGFVDVPMLIGELPGSGFDLLFHGTAVGLFVAAGPDAGIIEYSIDGGVWEKRDLFTKWSSLLHIPWLNILTAELEPLTTHKLSVRISDDKNRESTGHACRIVNFAVNADEACFNVKRTRNTTNIW